MKDLVVCIKKNWKATTGPKLVYGEIYTRMAGSRHEGFTCLVEFGTDWVFDESGLRPVDDTYGPAICETIEQEIELEKVLN